MNFDFEISRVDYIITELCMTDLHISWYSIGFKVCLRIITISAALFDFLFLPETEFFSIFIGAGKFCLAHGLRQLAGDTKSDVSCLQMSPARCNEKLRMTFGVGRHKTLIVKML